MLSTRSHAYVLVQKDMMVIIVKIKYHVQQEQTTHSVKMRVILPVLSVTIHALAHAKKVHLPVFIVKLKFYTIAIFPTRCDGILPLNCIHDGPMHTV